MQLAVLREYFWSLPSWRAAKENWLIFGVYIVVWGSNGGPQGPRWPIHGPCYGQGGLREEKVHLAVSREYYWSIPSWKVAMENGLFLGVNIVVWGLGWGSSGSQMAETWPHATSEVS